MPDQPHDKPSFEPAQLVDLGEPTAQDPEQYLDRPITIFEVAVFTTKSLDAAGITTVRELVRKTAAELATLRFDPRSVRELKELLAEVGLTLGLSV
jgi:DNA-directed RNA polymerase alpha subunit